MSSERSIMQIVRKRLINLKSSAFTAHAVARPLTCAS
ncbi:hypothetical protein SFHH103_psfHH103d_385 (plasmid) [Sinorhizobium fredii HH103]|nr:hypothetical protein SFHH103_psfHH103d_385 [Sinorhizobium fredii HH103]